MLKSFKIRVAVSYIIITLFVILSITSVNADTRLINPTGTLNGPGVSTTEPQETAIATSQVSRAEQEKVLPELIGELGEDQLVVPIKFDGASEFRIIVGQKCKVVESIVLKTLDSIDGKLKVTDVSENPTGSQLEKTLSYCRFELENIDNSKVESINWKLKANRNELTDKKYDKDAIKLVIFEENQWSTKETKRIDGDTDNFIYSSESSNFGDGFVTLAEVNAGLFTLRNILYCIGSLIGLGLLLIVGYSLIDDKEGKK